MRWERENHEGNVYQSAPSAASDAHTSSLSLRAGCAQVFGRPPVGVHVSVVGSRTFPFHIPIASVLTRGAATRVPYFVKSCFLAMRLDKRRIEKMVPMGNDKSPRPAQTKAMSRMYRRRYTAEATQNWVGRLRPLADAAEPE